MARRARARAATLAPTTKARVRALLPRRRSEVTWLRRGLDSSPGSRVLGVGPFDPALASELIEHGADIVDARPANRDANIVADLAVDGAALAGPYDLIVAQEPAAASTGTGRMVTILAGALADEGTLMLTTTPGGPLETTLRSIPGAEVNSVSLRSGVALEVSIR